MWARVEILRWGSIDTHGTEGTMGLRRLRPKSPTSPPTPGPPPSPETGARSHLARTKRKPATKGRLFIFNPASSTGIKPPPQRYSALQLNPDHLKRFVAQILREMIERRKVHDLSRLCFNVFGLPVRIREARMTVGHENSNERRMAVHRRFLMWPILDAEHPHPLIL